MKINLLNEDTQEDREESVPSLRVALASLRAICTKQRRNICVGVLCQLFIPVSLIRGQSWVEHGIKEVYWSGISWLAAGPGSRILPYGSGEYKQDNDWIPEGSW